MGGYILSRFSTIFDKLDNFCDFLFAFLPTHPLLIRFLFSKRKNLLPNRVYPFSEGSKNSFDKADTP